MKNKNRKVSFSAQTQDLKDFFVESASVLGLGNLSTLANKAVVEFIRRHGQPEQKEKLKQLLVEAVRNDLHKVENNNE